MLIIPTTDQIPTGYNETGFSNARYDELYQQQGVELDRDTRREMIWEMQSIVHENVPYIIPYYPFTIQAYRVDRFTGWRDSDIKVALEDPSSLLNIEPVK
jgi:peptide/nickel transport system substrate-binding protein